MGTGEAFGLRRRAFAAHAALAGTLALVALVLAAQPPPATAPERSASAAESPPLAFVPNAGQTDAAVEYMARGAGYAFYFTPHKAVLDFQRGERGVALDLRFRGANPNPQILSERPTAGRVNHLVGSRPHGNLPTYAQLRYRELWPGIDVVFRGQGGQLKYEFLVRPGADPRDIRLAYAGAESLSLGGGGALLIGTPLGTLRDRAPKSVQGGTAIASRYAVSGFSYSFALGSYDRSRPLVIDPGLVYSTYLSGNGEDWAHSVEVDATGNSYIVGDTSSTDYPTAPGAYDTTYNGQYDAFVTKLGPGGAVVYSTYLGGSPGEDPPGTFYGGVDRAKDVAVDEQGNVYVTGSTDSIDFPTTPGAYVSSNPTGEIYEFVTKLNPTGSALVYSTLVGAGVSTQGTIDIDGSGHAYIGGQTFSSSYPTTPGTFRTAPSSGYVTKLNPTGTALVYSTYFEAIVSRLEVDDQGNAFLTGRGSAGLPTTPGAYDTTPNGGAEAYVTKLNAAGNGLVYSTFLGSTSDDHGADITIDDAGNAYVTGVAGTSNFPTTPGAYSTAFIGHAFATKLNPAGSALVYSTFLAGNEFLGRYGGIDVDAQGSAYVTGEIADPGLEATPDAYDATFNGVQDAYLVKLTPSGSALAYATYVGGSDRDWAYGVAVDGQQNAYIVGYTWSTDYPTTLGAAYGDAAGQDAFVTKLNTTPFPGYARPKGATPAYLSLTTAYEPCTDPNEIHGPPLAFGSCGGPQMTSDFLTVGTGDSNQRPARNEGYVVLRVLPGNPATPADEADVQIELFSDDIFTKELADYAGELRATYSVRITDRDNAPVGGGAAGPATTTDVPLGATFPCTPVADPQEGSSCSATTTIDALIPGAIREGKRAIWQLDRVRVFDGGADGDGDTVGDNTLFATQGVFVP